MSEDVITLDSSDEESKPAKQIPKPKNHVIQQKKQFPQAKNDKNRGVLSKPVPIKKPLNILPNPRISGRDVNPYSLPKHQVPLINPLNYPNAFNAIGMGTSNFPRLPNHNNMPSSNFNAKKVRYNPRSALNIPIRSQNISQLPIIVNTTSLVNPLKKRPSSQPQSLLRNKALSISKINTKNVPQNFLQSLPAGITIKRMTAGDKNKNKRPLSPDSVVFNKRLKAIPEFDPSDIPTVELDDDDEDQNMEQVGQEIPVEFEINGAHNDSDDTKENDNSIVIEIPPKDPLADSVLNSNKIVAENQPMDVEIEAVETNSAVLNKSDYYTPKKAENTEQIKVDEKIVKSICVDEKESSKQDEDVNSAVEPVRNSTDTKEDKDSLDVEEKIVIDKSNIKEVIVQIKMKPEDVCTVVNYEKNIQKTKPKMKSQPLDSERKINNTYQRFIDLCFELDNSEDMKKIVEKKVKAYYLSVHSSYTESKIFCKFVEDKIQDIKKNSDSLFLYIKEVVDELKVRRVKPKKTQESVKEIPKPSTSRHQEEASEQSGEESEEDSVTTKRINKLERALKKLHKAIKKLEEREISDDEDNSSYILADRYKSRLIRIYQKLCSITGERDAASTAAKSTIRGLGRLVLCGDRFPKLSAAVKAAASSRPHWFPDYVDVLRCVEHCAKEQGLHLRPDELQREAREAFIEIGTLLQQKRREAEFEDISWRLGASGDPADEDPALAAALLRNREMAKNKEMEIINKFADKQLNLKLVPEDVLDVEADKSEGSNESEGESEEEESNEEALTKETSNDEKREDKSNSEKTTNKNKDNTENDCKGEESVIEESKITEICSYLKLERRKSLAEEKFETLDDDKSNSSQISVISHLSLIELSSSDSRDSLNSSGEVDTEDSKKAPRFEKLQTIRPSSAMSGVNVIEDGSSLSCNGRTTDKHSSDVIMEIDESNDAQLVKDKGIVCSVDYSIDDDNAVDEIIVSKATAESEDNETNEKEVENIDLVILEDKSINESIKCKSPDKNVCIEIDSNHISPICNDQESNSCNKVVDCENDKEKLSVTTEEINSVKDSDDCVVSKPSNSDKKMHVETAEDIEEPVETLLEEIKEVSMTYSVEFDAHQEMYEENVDTGLDEVPESERLDDAANDFSEDIRIIDCKSITTYEGLDVENASPEMYHDDIEIDEDDVTERCISQRQNNS